MSQNSTSPICRRVAIDELRLGLMPDQEVEQGAAFVGIEACDGGREAFVWQAIGDICDLFTPAECKNYFTAAGYGFT